MSEDIDSLKDAEKENLVLEPSDLIVDDKGVAVSTDRSHSWVGGLILIGIGLIFLLNVTTGFTLYNWWALFILIPGIAKLLESVKSLRTHGRFDSEARSSLTWGLVLMLVAFTFLFDWSWSLIWPVFLIIFGIGALLSGVLD